MNWLRSMLMAALDAGAGGGFDTPAQETPAEEPIPGPEAEATGQEGESEVESDDSAGLEASETSDGSPSEDKPGTSQAKSVFGSLLDEEFGEPAESKEEELPADVKPGSRAEGEIRKLRERAQRAESEWNNQQQILRQRDQEVGQYIQTMNSRLQQLAEQNAQMRGQLQEITRTREEPGEKDTPYIAEMKRRMSQSIAEEHVAPLRKELENANKRIEELVGKETSREHEAKLDAIGQQLRQDAAKNFYDVVMRGVPQEKAAKLEALGRTVSLAMRRLTNGDGRQSAIALRRFVLEAADMISESASSSAKEALNKKKDAPAVSSRGGSGGHVSEKAPPMDVLVHNGFQSPWEWREAGKPPLKPLPKN